MQKYKITDIQTDAARRYFEIVFSLVTKFSDEEVLLWLPYGIQPNKLGYTKEELSKHIGLGKIKSERALL